MTEETIQLNKLEILLLNNGWNDNNEKLLVTIEKNCQIFRSLHINASEYYQKIDKTLKISLLTIGVILSTGSSFSLFVSEYNLTILQKIFIFISTLISAVNNFLKSSELSEKHIQASKQFLVISADIRDMLCMYRKNRMNSVKYIQLLNKQYDNIRDNSPKIPEIYLKNLQKYIDKKDYFDIQLKDIINHDTNVNTNTNTNANINTNTNTGIDDGANVNTENQDSQQRNIQEETIRPIFRNDIGELDENDKIILENSKNTSNILQQKMQYELDRFKFH